MKPASSPVLAFAVAMASLLSPTFAGAAEPMPNLVGVWSGKVEAGVSHGIQTHEPEVTEPTFGNYELTFTLTIQEQEGRAVSGTWSLANHSERIFGVLRRNNTDLIFVDEDSYFDGLLLSATSMELCLAETHELAMGVWCLPMMKQAP